ncbi:MAG: TIGR02996 domain-containing protein [Polyangiales bacterium]
MLARWRKNPASELGDALDAELATTTANATPVDQKEWIARAKAVAPDDLPELAALLSTLRVKKLEDTRLRVNAIARLLPDPRIARALGDFMAAVPFTSNSSMTLWADVFDVLGRAGDPRALAWIVAVREALAVRPAFQTFFEEQLRTLETKLRTAFPNGAPPPDEAVRTVPAKPAVARDGAALFADVYAHPEADGPRLVLADLLQERGDPRGELIMLQCQSPNPKRERELLKAHGKEWCAELAPFVSGDIRFRRGFPASATLRFKNAMVAQRALDLPAWSTLEEITVAGVRSLPRTLRAARVIHGLSDSALDSLLSDCPHLRPRRISVGRLSPHDAWARFEGSAAASELVELENVPIDWLGVSLAKLQKLSVSERLTDKHLEAVRAHPQLVIELDGGELLTRIEMREGKLSVTLTMSKLAEREPGWGNPDGEHVRSWLGMRADQMIEQLVRPVGLRSIESLTLERRPPDPELLDASAAEELEARVRERMIAHLDRLEALSSFDLRAVGGPNGDRTPRAAIAAAPQILPEIEAYARLSWCSDGTLFVLQQGTTLLLDPESGSFRREIATDGGAFASTMVTPDGRTLAWATPGAAYVVDLHSGDEVRRVQHGCGFITLAALSGDGRRLLMLLGDVYRARKAEVISLGEPKAETMLSRTSIQNGTLSHDGRFCILARGRDIQLVELDQGGDPITLAKAAVDSYTHCAISPSGRTLAVETNEHALVVYDLVERREKARFQLQDRCEHVCDDRIVAVATDQGIVVLEIESGTSHTIATKPAHHLAIAPDSKRIAARIEGALVVVDLDGRESLRIACSD